MAQLYDALIIGGGPAGGAAGLLLARAGWTVLIVERKAFPRRKVCGEYLSGTNLPLFDHLGIGERFRELAGPAVTQVGLFTRNTMAQAPLPRPAGNASWGRALAREHLDTWILEQALRAGAEIRQPATAEEILPDSGNYQCRLKTESSQEEVVRAKLIIAGHGSWDPGHLPTQRARLDSLPSDLLAFKAHFTNSDLAPGLMPLLAFPGGYGGMVHVDESRVSLSCCLRRDILALDRQRHPGPAGEAVLGHIQEHCRGVRLALHSARREGEWLSAGPIRPGIRLRFPGGIFPVGNLAGEAHPVIAEGISMALQSSWLLCQRLIAWRTQGAQRAELPGLGSAYAGDWRRYFSPRLQASRLLAEWAMRPALVSAAIPLVWSCPALLTWVARVTGKAHGVIKSSGFPALGSYS